MSCLRLLGGITLLLSFSVPAAWPQSVGSQGSRTPESTSPESRIPDERRGRELAVQRNVEKQEGKKRFEEVKRDSQKLLELATELKRDVDKSGENVLSLDVVRKAEEMEKLARQVKKNMRSE